MKRKFYVVWEGRSPGVYDDWEDAREQIENWPGAKYKGFATQEEAVAAFRSYEANEGIPLGEILVGASMASNAGTSAQNWTDFPEIDRDGWAVDASCMGNPGVMEYRGVELATGRELFRVGPFDDATNNIGEFLAIVHALALQYRDGSRHTVYSDSRTGMSWVKNRRIKTTLAPTERNRKVFELMERGLQWLSTHQYSTPVRKWETELWGEIPADFGRK